jgi:3-oxoadipate enol-lactonase
MLSQEEYSGLNFINNHFREKSSMAFLQLGSIRLNYKVTGLGVPLVLVGGLGMPLQGWAMQEKAFSRSFQMIRLDNRGCGKTSTPGEPFSIQDMAKDVIALLDHLELDCAHVLGLSMGGFIALEMAAMASHRVKSLVLAHTTAKLPTITKYRIRLWRDMRQEAVSSSLLAREQLLWIFPEKMLQDHSVVESLIQNMIYAIESQPAEGFKSQAEACETFDILKRLPEITVPTLIISAEDDISAPLAHTKQLELLPNVLRTKVFPSAGHVSHIVHAEEFNREVTDFVQSVECRE